MTFPPSQIDRVPGVGANCGGCCWYSGDMQFVDVVLYDYQATDMQGPCTINHVWREWMCPVCTKGRMVYTGEYWPTGDPGYHHMCLECKAVLAIHKAKWPGPTRLTFRQYSRVELPELTKPE